MSDDDNTELIIAVVALVISALAFFIAILQALQQYFASATGFSSCSEATIGKWSKFTRRRMYWTEFRFEVKFEVPVIFVATPKNTRGPLGDDKDVINKNRKIIHLDGGEQTFKYTSSIQEVEAQNKVSKQELVHTANNEKATWYELLMAIGRMEKESRTWQEQKSSEWQKLHGPPKDFQQDLSNNPPTSNAVAPTKNHTLVVCMQRKKRTWDSMPVGLGKPYATTTISHIVEICGMLGIHWKTFDLDADQYRAQGNGFLLYGSYVDNLGITFTFQKQGPSWFKKDRIVPNYEVKKLCFGIAPTIFERESEQVLADEPKDLGSLQLGSFAEIAQTLAMFGCDIKTVNYFRHNLESTRHGHLFPIPFELLGMVGEMLHVEGTVFRMLPNPTVFYWDPSSFSLSNLVVEFRNSLGSLSQEEDMKDSKVIGRIIDWIDDPRISLVREPTSAVKDTIEYVNGAKLMDNLNYLRGGIELCDGHLQETRFMVRKVMRAHIQEVLDVLNRQHSEGHETEDAMRARKENQVRIQDMDSAFPGDKEILLMNMYTGTIRQKVVQVVCKQETLRRERHAKQASTGHGNAVDAKPARQVTERLVNETWCTLIFRMLCWLQLHDFHAKDIQVSKSDVYASRIPVHIK